MSKFQRMTTSRRMTLSWLVAIFLALTLGQRVAHAAELRFALVIGNDEYKSAKLTTPANDAGLVADALTAAGFTVTGARNLDQATLRESFREFLDQVAAAGPDAVVVVYLAGFGVQFAGENYFMPVDADFARAVDGAAAGRAGIRFRAASGGAVLSFKPVFAARRRHVGRAPRRDHLAALRVQQHAAGL
jgi:Caspase domain